MTLTEALAGLHRTGLIRSPWLPGMRALLDRGEGGLIPFRRSDDGLRWVFPSDIENANSIVDRDAEPDLADPATVGCLLALFREASGHTDASIMIHTDGWMFRLERTGTADFPRFIRRTEGWCIRDAIIEWAELRAWDR